jgi:two-component system phosphate regulon sensor histidine kinase PhoR
MRRHSFFFKLFLGNLAIVLLVLGGTAAVFHHLIEDEYLRTMYVYQDYVAQIAQQYLEHVWPRPDAEIDRLCKRFLEKPKGDGLAPGSGTLPTHGIPERLTVIASDGRVLGDSRSDPAQMENHKGPTRPEVLAALEGRPGRFVRRSETLAADYRYVALPIRHEEAVAGVVRVAMPLAAVHESHAFIHEAILWSVVLGVAAFALLALLVNWIWSAPLKQITAVASQIASGDLEHRARVSGSDELALLGLALNAMRDHLARQIATITAQRENLQQVVTNLREGIIAVDASGKIVLANQAATDLLAAGAGEVAGRPLQAVVRASAVVDVYNRSMATRRPVSCQTEIDVRGRPCHVDVLALPLAGGTADIVGLVAVRDVTDLVRTAAMKAEFAANASHELRTPLATLHAAVETLAACDPADRESFARIVAMLGRHLKRLEDLTADLLALHAVESAKRELVREPIRMDSLQEAVRLQFAEAAARKGVTLEFNVPSPAETVTTDRKLVELVLQNLVDNAIKFTPAGGRVTCSMAREGGQARFRVADTGSGIPREDQPRVFERFFQSDTARSGDALARGTGLGLAIVKHVCERLGAKVSLESELGTGTTVTVLAPDRPDA